MYSSLNIDELNIQQYTDEEVEAFLNDYFAPMELPFIEEETRKNAAKDFRDVLLFILLAIVYSVETEAIDWDYMRNQMAVSFGQVVRKYARDDDFTRDFIEKAADEFIDVTRRHADEGGRWLSDERALPDAANYANMTVGYEELQQAIDDGFTKKMWISQRDGKVRHTHRIADGQTVPIKAMFKVGASLLMYPADPEGEPQEVISCRCHMKYL
jgi:hypothetical protein